MAVRNLTNQNKPNWRFYDFPQDESPEFHMAESLAMEFTDIVGMDCIYYINSLAVEADQLYGEKMNVEYEEGKQTKIIYELGEIPTIYTLFGVMAQDSITSYIPLSVYRRDVSQTQFPKVGDVIKVPLYPQDFTNDYTQFGRTFEIIHVAQDTSIFKYRSLVYVLNLIPYRYSEESVSAADVSSDLASLDTTHVRDYGDNEFINEKVDSGDVDKSVYGY